MCDPVWVQDTLSIHITTYMVKIWNDLNQNLGNSQALKGKADVQMGHLSEKAIHFFAHIPEQSWIKVIPQSAC